jgi:hypothetical protein
MKLLRFLENVSNCMFDEKVGDKICWTIIGLAATYFGGHIIFSLIFNFL